MTKILKSKYKASRRLRTSIWGDAKDPFLKKNYGPGMHGPSSRGTKPSDYGEHLKAKQILKSHYGRVTERQFKTDFMKADRKKGNTALNFISMLERRLDVVVYRLNFAPTIFAARQLVSHKHIKVNDKVVNIGSYKVKDGDIISIVEKAKTIPVVAESLQKPSRSVPSYLTLDAENFNGKFINSPDSISSVPYPFEVDMNLIVEHYSK